MRSNWLRQFPKVLFASLRAWVEHRTASKGAALAFYALFSMTPILLLSIAAAGYFFGKAAAQGEIIAQIEGWVGPQSARTIQALVAAARNPSSGLLATTIATLLLLITTTSVFVDLKGSLDEIWEVEAPKGMVFSRYMRLQLYSFGLVLLVCLLLLISLVISIALAILRQHSTNQWGEPALPFAALTAIIAFGAITCLFAVIYKALPEVLLSWRDVWIGAAFTGGLFSLGKYLIALYLNSTTVTSSVSVAGSMVALLVWVYYSAQIFFLGAEFTRQYALLYGSLRNTQAKDPDNSSGPY